MKTIVKLLAWVTGAVVLLAVGIVMYVTLAVDLNVYKEEISVLIESETALKLDRVGNLDLNVGRLVWEDHGSNSTMVFENIDLTAGLPASCRRNSEAGVA